MDAEDKEDLSYWRRTSRDPMDEDLEKVFINEDNMRANDRYDSRKEGAGRSSVGSQKARPKKKKRVAKLTDFGFKKVSNFNGSLPNQNRSRNFQGFSMSRCTYIDSVKKFCYVPKVYYGKFTPEDVGRGGPDFCTSCLLDPCITRGKALEIQKVLHREEEYLERRGLNEREVAATLKRMATDKVVELMEQIFTPTYVRKFGVPCCFKAYIDDKLGKTSFIDDLHLRSMEVLQSSDSEEDMESEHSDAENEFK